MYVINQDGETKKVERIQDMSQNKGGNPERYKVLWCPICDFSTDSRQLHQGCGGCGAAFVEYMLESEPPDQPVRRAAKTLEALRLTESRRNAPCTSLLTIASATRIEYGLDLLGGKGAVVDSDFVDETIKPSNIAERPRYRSHIKLSTSWGVNGYAGSTDWCPIQI